MPSLSDKAGVLIASNFVKYAVGFVMPMVLVRMLTKHDYGTLQQLQLIASTAVGVLVLGLPGSVYYFYKDDHEYSRVALVQQTLALLALSGAVTTAALVVGAGQISDWMSNALLLRYLPFFALSVGLSIADEHFVPFMIAQNRYLAAVLFETGETMVRVLVSVLPLIAGFGLTGLLESVLEFVIKPFDFLPTRFGFFSPPPRVRRKLSGNNCRHGKRSESDPVLRIGNIESI